MRPARHFAEWISDISWSINGGHDPRYGIWNQAVCLLCQRVILSEFTQSSKVEGYETENQARVDTEYE